MKRSYQNPSASAWRQSVLRDASRFPFAFTYDGVRYEGFSPAQFTELSRAERTEKLRETTELRWRLRECLEVTLNCSYYPSHGVTEWTVWFENPSDADSGILESPETRLRFEGAHPVLKGILGDHVNQYRPYCEDLTAKPVRFRNDEGRATHILFPYFNLEHGDGGTLLAIGWAGTWEADFFFDGEATTYTARSVNGLHTRLKPGEKIRTALFVCAPYPVRDEHYAMNFWRDWFVRCNLPSADRGGAPLAPFSTCCLAHDTGLPNSDGSISERHTTWKPSLEKMLAEDVRVDFRWVDAGWYAAPNGASPDASTPDLDWAWTIGTWELDPAKWPGHTFRDSTDYAREHGMKTLMWFEPERVADPDSLVERHGYRAEWAIRCTDLEEAKSMPAKGRRTQWAVNNIGDPDCFRWTLERITRTLRENRVEMYREDNNNPAIGWLLKYNDRREGPDRQGISESKHIEAHYRLWDEIIACTLSYGGCGFVDSCASGGGRNDLESLRRSVPLLRSDADRTSTALRLSMTTAFNQWIPFCGALTREKTSELTAEGASDPYIWRASYLPALNVESQFVQKPDQDFSVLRDGIAEWKRINPYLLKDFYVLTPWHAPRDDAGFTAFSFFDAEDASGILLAFRQEKCSGSELVLRLPFVGEDETCVLTDEDSGEVLRVSGREMRLHGAALTFDAPRTARLLWVRVEAK